MKKCTKCKIEKPATPAYFHRSKNRKDGLVNDCKECVKKRTQKHYKKNREEKREYNKKYYHDNREYHAEYYHDNREEKLEYGRSHYKENREYYSEFMKKYHLENPEAIRFNNQRRKARMAELPHTLTVEEWDETLEYFNNECAYCGDSESGLAQEHVIPVSKGGPYTQENIIPACKSCNSSKHVTELEEWYVRYKHYDKERLNKILGYVGIMEEI